MIPACVTVTLGKGVTVVNRILGTVLQVVAVVVWIQFVANQFYDPSQTGLSFQVWSVLNPINVLCLLGTIYVGLLRKRSLADAEEGALTKEYFEANVTLYGGIILLHAILWNWFGSRFSDPAISFRWIWILVDVTLPLLLFSTGRHLARSKVSLT